MQVAELLSDLTSLQVCDSNAALALVSARADGSSSSQDVKQQASDGADKDLRRAKDLLDLHATVKVAHQDGTDEDLSEAREAVDRVLRSL